MKLALAVLVVVLLAPRGAEACKRGSLLLRITTTPLAGGAADVLEVRSKGAWTRNEESGCLGKAGLKLLKRAVKKARFQKSTPTINCRALASAEVLLEGAKKKQRVTIKVPCTDELDTWTAVASSCAEEVTRDGATDDSMAIACNPEEEVAVAECKGGARVFRIESTPNQGGDTEVIEVKAGGAWSANGATGCLGDKRLAAVKRAAKAARFKYAKGMTVCDAVPTTKVVYLGAGKKQRIETESPCGRVLDGATEAAAACVTAAVDTAIGDDDVIATCNAQVAQAEPFCEGGEIVFAQTMAQTAVLVGPEDQYYTAPLVNAEVRSSGAWMLNRDDGTWLQGCLSKPQLKRLTRLAAKAKFKVAEGKACDAALATVTYRGAKARQTVTMDVDCDDRVDAATAAAARCLLAVAREVPPETEVDEACGK